MKTLPLARSLVALLVSSAALAQMPTPTPGHCPYTFADNFPADVSCAYSGPFNANPACPTDVAALMLSTSTLVVVGLATNPVVTFGASVTSATSADLVAYFVGDDPTAQPVSGTIELQQTGGVLIIHPDAAPFGIAGCAFDQYAGAFVQLLVAPPTPTPTATPTATPTNTPTFLPYGISGHVLYYGSQLPVAGVTVELQGPVPAAMQTDATGHYAFTDIGAQSWRVQPRRTAGVGSAVSALDAVYVLQRSLGLRPFSSEQQLACDVSGNGLLSALDAVLILQRSLGIVPSFPVALTCGSDWAFVPVPTGAGAIPPQIQAGSCQPGALVFDPLASQADGQDFEAVAFGDCTGNWH